MQKQSSPPKNLSPRSHREETEPIVPKAKTPRANYVAVLSARYFRDVKGPMIELEVQNKADKPVKTVHFHAKLKSPDRETPWAEENFTYSPEGGLGVDEIAAWTLEAGRGSHFRSAKPTDNATLTVEMKSIDFVD